ncbi:transcription cofactor vestigial-like protein 1 isoform X1 [Tamandua tetradactyla]|uniref:transcription cofactor vestigial-like protein 1 isoform X1 n=1 Tax=Tamandua tetradactyla TaxID=48850 RepID=UPI004053BF4B
MEEMKSGVCLPKDRQRPIKTEWNSRCVLFTYFQGDISTVVDEHFSRALGNVKSPQELSSLSQSEDVILKNDSDMPPNQWRFSSQCTKPQPDVPLGHGAANGSLNVSGPMTMDQYPLALTESPSTQPDKKIYFPPNRGPASASLANERNWSPERRQNLFFY